MVPASTSTPMRPLAESPVLEPRFGLSLMDGERVLVAGQPQRDLLMRYLMVSATLLVALTGFGLLLLPLIYWALRAFVGKHRYWLTSSRVIVTTGIIGFRARSIPLERVSDVALSCNWLERTMGLRSVMVRDMTGEAMSGASMLAAPDAGSLQREILDAVHAVNRRSGPTASEPANTPYRALPDVKAQDAMLQLLRQIERNTRSAA